ncbi:microtubule-associated protein RP/EB family member 1-like [Aethina tumida]|uniref:microtubule-associated protein RP/EB family member 1-like n=1 Tax=Aethina tumida TaxID=116153 RepID=UPI002148A4CB|nr:microtubule-associated protein RP/EB family member 1-like [Aethina tumida]
MTSDNSSRHQIDSDYCQIMHYLFFNSIQLARVKFNSNQECSHIHNYTLLQKSFKKLKVDKEVPVDQLIRGRFQDNFEFLQWFKKFYDVNYRGTCHKNS